MNERTITMTVHAIEAALIETTQFAGPRSWYMGYVTVKAHGDGELHEWRVLDGSNFHLGQTLTVNVIENEEPGPRIGTPIVVPPIDKSTT